MSDELKAISHKTKCDICDCTFISEDALIKHKESHSNKSRWLKKLKRTETDFYKIKSMLFQSITYLKQKEKEKKIFCNKYCNINHEKFNWVNKKSDMLF